MHTAAVPIRPGPETFIISAESQIANRVYYYIRRLSILRVLEQQIHVILKHPPESNVRVSLHLSLLLLPRCPLGSHLFHPLDVSQARSLTHSLPAAAAFSSGVKPNPCFFQAMAFLPKKTK